MDSKALLAEVNWSSDHGMLQDLYPEGRSSQEDVASLWDSVEDLKMQARLLIEDCEMEAARTLGLL